MRTFWKALLLLFVLPGSGITGSPGEEVQAAAVDIQKVPEHDRPYARYLSFYNYPEEKKVDEARKVLAFHVNSLSRNRLLKPLRLVSPTLVAIDIRHYHWDALVWERLAAVEPYFHQKEKLLVDVEVREVYPGDKEHKRGRYRTPRKKGEVIDVAGFWLPTQAIIALREAAYSEVPIVRADWFLFQTAIQKDRVAGYYDWLGLGKKEADFDELIGVDQKKSRKFGAEIAAIMARSGVTLKNRGIIRLQGLGGGYWITQDYEKGVDRQNIIRLLHDGVDPPQGDASERYGILANGLFAFWLQNKDGLRQDTAPDFIASDGNVPGNDRRVHIGKSCISCHVEGLRPIKDWVRKVYRNNLRIQTPKGDDEKKAFEKFQRIEQLYLSDLQEEYDRDVTIYTRALFKVSGMKPAEMARAYGRMFDEYEKGEVTSAVFARELGVDEKVMLAAFKKYATPPPVGVGNLDPLLAGLIADDPEPLVREHAEEVYSLAQVVLKGGK